MSFAAQNLATFIELLETHSSLFSLENFVELSELISPIPDDIEQMSIAVAGWYQKHPNILTEQLALLKNEVNNNHRKPGSEQANPNIPKFKLDKRTLLNAIQQSSLAAEGKNQTSNN